MDGVRIDLRRPAFPADVQAALDAGASVADLYPLEADVLIARAREETGLHDLGDPGFRVPLDVLLDALRREPGLSAMGRLGTFMQLLQLMKNRLLVEDVIARHPEVLDLEVRRPIIVAGLPRTGTTHLQNLIAADPSLRFLPYWQAVEPVLGAAEAATLAPGDPDPRVTRCDTNLAFLDQALPHFKAMFDLGTHHAHEEINLLGIDFSTMFFDTMGDIPSWRAHYRATDQRPHYAYLKRVLQVLQHTDPRTGADGQPARWILKSPQHLEQFGPLIDTFPDATVLVTHRDPVAVTASMATMITYVSWMSHEMIDPPRLARQWATTIEQMLAAAVADRHLLPDDRSLDIRFDDFMADEPAVLAQAYAVADQPLDAAARAAHEAYLAEHRRGRHGALRYDLDELALDADDLRARNAVYRDRFSV